jgi:hypothetical protein
MRHELHVPDAASLTIVPHRYRCSRGHEFTQFVTSPFRLWTVGVEPERASKSLCPYCYLDWIEANVSTVEEETVCP